MNRAQNVPPRFASALERLDGEVALLCEMAAITSEDLPEVQAKTEAALEEGDCERAASGLHKLKGMLSTFEAEGVTLEIQEMLDAARKGNIGEARSAYHEHRDDIDSLAQEIRQLAAHSS